MGKSICALQHNFISLQFLFQVKYKKIIIQPIQE